MKRVAVVVTLVTLFAIFFQLSPTLGVPDRLIYAMFIIAPFLLIFMVYTILKHGEPSGKTFDEQFYDDWDYKRNGIE